MTAAVHVILATGLVLAATCPASAQEASSLARAHYLAAEYDQALDALGRPHPDEPAEADRLRALCLIALGRLDDADAVMARVVLADPSFEPSAEASPRVRGAFRAVRMRVLPARGRALYEAGKAAFASRAFPEAIASFDEALPILEVLAHEGRSDMEELRILANDFLLLSRRLLPPPAPAPPPPLQALPWNPSDWLVSPAAAGPPVVPPVPIKQDLPPWTHGLGGSDLPFHGAVEVLIDPLGRVARAAIIEPVHPLYDAELLRAAREWRYEPARHAGQPVTASKRVEVALRTR